MLRRLPGLDPLRLPEYRLLWCSSLASAGAQWMERVLTGWLALEVGGDALAVGTVFALRMLPFWLFGLLAGTLADRLPRRAVLMAVAAGGASVAVLMSLAAGSGAIEMWQIVGLSFLSGCVFVFDMPARGALLVDLVGRERASSAIALNAVALRFFGAVGAFAGGLVIPLLGIGGGYLVVVAAYLVGMALVASVRVPESARVAPGAPVSFGRAFVEAARLIVEYPAVRMILFVSAAAEMFGYSYQSAMPTVARDVLRIGPEGLGALTGAASIGSTLAVILLAFLPTSIRRQPIVSGILVVWGVSLVALGSTSDFALALAIMLVVGGCASALDALQQTLAQMAVPEHQRGRAVGVWVFSIGMNLVGLFQVGWLAATIGAPTTLMLEGSLGIAAALLIVALAPSFRWRRVLVPSPHGSGHPGGARGGPG